MRAGHDRLVGWRQELDAAGLDSSLVAYGDFTEHSGTKACADLAVTAHRVLGLRDVSRADIIVRPDGTPHSVPRWGVWLDGRFWYDGAPTTRHTRRRPLNEATS